MTLHITGDAPNQLLDWYTSDGEILVESMTAAVVGWAVTKTRGRGPEVRLMVLVSLSDAHLLLDGLADSAQIDKARSVPLLANPGAPHVHSHTSRVLSAPHLGVVAIDMYGARERLTVAALHADLPPTGRGMAKITITAGALIRTVGY